MERKFECDDGAFLRVTVCAVYNEEGVYDYDVSYVDHDTGENIIIPVIEEQLAPIEEVVNCEPNIDWQATYNEYSEKARRTIASLSKRITELNALLKDAQSKADGLNSALKEQDSAYADVVSKNAALTKNNRELEENLSNKKGEVKHWRGMYIHMKERCNEYKRAADNLMVERDRADDELALTRIMNTALAEKIERMQNNG
jgi:chromosome segregation ATPase